MPRYGPSMQRWVLSSHWRVVQSPGGQSAHPAAIDSDLCRKVYRLGWPVLWPAVMTPGGKGEGGWRTRCTGRVLLGSHPWGVPPARWAVAGLECAPGGWGPCCSLGCVRLDNMAGGQCVWGSRGGGCVWDLWPAPPGCPR
jgi:hypothetical protein